jgi:hypothetical protein
MRFAFAHKLVAYIFAGLGLIALMLGTTFSLRSDRSGPWW